MMRGPSLHSGHGKASAPGKPAPILPAPSSILEGAADEEVGLKSHIHHAITGLKSITARWLGQAAGISEHTAYHKADPNADEARLTWRVLDAAVLSGVPELVSGVLGALARRWGITWGRAEALTGVTTDSIMEQILNSDVASTEAKVLELVSLRDGHISRAEIVALRAKWAREDHEKARRREMIEAYAAEPEDEGGQLGALERARRIR